MSRPSPFPVAAVTLPHTRMSFTRWVRARSEQQLLLVAQRTVALRHGTPPPPAPKGLDVFWQKVYAPVFYRLPYALRAKVAGAMPGSHRQTWHTPEQAKGPAV